MAVGDLGVPSSPPRAHENVEAAKGGRWSPGLIHEGPRET